MSNRNRTTKVRNISIIIASLFAGSAYAADGYTYSGWLAQIGVNQAMQTQALNAKGLILGVVDSGVVASNAEINGRVLSSSGCTAVSFKCSNGVNDDNGHGTAVASIAAGGYIPLQGTSKLSMVGVAPGASIYAAKSFNASGAASDADVANGIKAAANAGAAVINLSSTFSNSATITAAINYAASKGAFIVYAGGNQGTKFLNGANTTGLDANGLSHLVFVGSVSARNTLSTFSNTPGTGQAIGTTGVKQNYSSMWLMAPGENILAPNMTPSVVARYGASTYASWSGTSMSAPLVSGSLLLLEGAWPILKTRGTALSLLENTATSLGAATTFGYGEINVSKAWQPYGTLVVNQANGTQLNVLSLSTGMLSSGALGSLSSISSKLAAYPVFDGYTRNFTVNLSSLVGKPATTHLSSAPANFVAPTQQVAKLSDGTRLTFSGLAPNKPILNTDQPAFGTSMLQGSTSRPAWFALAERQDGTVMGMGYGYNFAGAVGAAMYGDSKLAFNASSLGVSNSLVDLANGGTYFAYGAPIGLGNVRMSFTSVKTAVVENNIAAVANGPDWVAPKASGMTVGLSSKITEDVTMGVTIGSLNETHGLLGANYDTNSILNFGDGNKSSNVAVSAGFDLGRGANLLLETSVARVAGANPTSGLITNVSGITARSYGMALTQSDLYRRGDMLSFTVKAPLRVTSGNASMYTTNVDPNTGEPYGATQNVSMVPDGRQVDLKLGYTAPVSKYSSMGFNVGYTMDDQNIRGAKNAAVGFTFNMKF